MKYIKTGSRLNIYHNKQYYHVSKDHKDFDKIYKLLKEKKFSQVEKIIEKINNEKLKKKSKGELEVIKNKIYISGEREFMPDDLNNIIIDFYKKGLPFSHLIKFYQKLKKNPSNSSKEELYSFIKYNNITINEKGNLILYKKVYNTHTSQGLVDLYTKTFNNNPGRTVQIARRKVDPDRNRTCSNGLHVASYSYARYSYGGQNDPLIMVEVDPKDVVSVPTDYGNQKMRVCRYKVLSVNIEKQDYNSNSNRAVVSISKAKKGSVVTFDGMKAIQIKEAINKKARKEVVDAPIKNKKKIIKQATEYLKGRGIEVI